MNSLCVDVFSHPLSARRVNNTISVLGGLSKALESQYGILLPIQARELSITSPGWAEFLGRFIDDSILRAGVVSSIWVFNLLWAARDARGDYIEETIKGSVEHEWIHSYIEEAVNRSADLHPVPAALFISLEGYPLSIGAKKWGETAYVFPLTVALETKGYVQVIFHECLHQFGVSEGYETDRDPLTGNETIVNHPGCASCWMQYDPTLGTGLCERHLSDLRGFLQSHNL